MMGRCVKKQPALAATARRKGQGKEQQKSLQQAAAAAGDIDTMQS